MGHRLRRQSGFTLLELFVGLAIAAILLGLGLPSLTAMLGGSGVSASTNELVYALNQTRSEAVKRAGVAKLCPSTNPLAAAPECTDGAAYHDGWIVFADSNENGIKEAAEPVIKQQGPSSGAIDITPSLSFVNGILFNSTGASTNAAGVPLAGSLTVDYGDGAAVRRVDIAANGRISSVEVP